MYRELLEIARELVARGGRRPRKESLARAVSTAYYALFHALAEFCAREMVGAWAPWQPFRHVYRSLEHSHARKIFAELRGSGEVGDDVKKIGDTFTHLQKLRHSADYDPGYRTFRRETYDLIDRVEEATQLLNQLPASDRKFLAARLIARSRA